MVKTLIIIAFGLCVVIAQGLAQSCGVPAWMIPQGLVSCVVFLAFFDFSIAAAAAAFSLGLLLDLTSATLLGPWAGAFVCVYALLAFLSRRLFIDSAIVTMIVSALSSMVAGIVYLLLAFEVQSLARDDVMNLVGQAVATAVVSPALVRALGRIVRKPAGPPLGRSSVMSAV